MRWIAALLIAATLACGSPPVPTRPPPADLSAAPLDTIALGYASGQFHTLPVRVNEHVLTVAILDTGIGLALISRALCERIGCTIDGELTAQRMSGQEVRVPLTRLERLSVGALTRVDVVAGVIDIEGFFPEPQIEAFVGLPFFREHAFTIDGPARVLTIESERSLAAREARGHAVPIRLHAHGPALDSFVRVTLGATEQSAEMLMDTGSRVVILHPRYAEGLGIDLDDARVRRRTGTDETGHAYERSFVTLEAPIAFAGVPALARTGVDVMFQEIIYDGLIGIELLGSFVVTWDLSGERIVIADP